MDTRHQAARGGRLEVEHELRRAYRLAVTHPVIGEVAELVAPLPTKRDLTPEELEGAPVEAVVGGGYTRLVPPSTVPLPGACEASRYFVVVVGAFPSEYTSHSTSRCGCTALRVAVSTAQRVRR